MAADSQVLKEFLVSLGFKINESTFAGFTAAVSGVTGKVIALAEVAYKAGESIVEFTEKVADKMEDLYFAGQRLHSSVAAIQNYALAISEMGGTASGARQSLEGLAQAIRTNPGVLTFIRGLGVDTSHGAVGIMRGLSQRFRAMIAAGPYGYAIASRYAQMLGIDDQTLWAMTHGPDLTGRDRFARFYKVAGMNADQVAEDAHKFENILRDIGGSFTVLNQIIEAKLLPYVRVVTDWFSHLFDSFLSHGTSLNTAADDIYKVVKGFADLSVAFVQFVASIPAVKAFFTWFFGWLETIATWTGRKVDTAANRASVAMETTAAALRGDKEAQKKVGGAGNKAFEALTGFSFKGGHEKLQPFQWSALFGNWKWESGLDPNRWGDKHTAYGIGQWHADRRAIFAKLFGHSMIGSSLAEQVQFGIWELFNSERAGGKKFFASKTLDAAATAYNKYVERPADYRASNRQRIHLAEETLKRLTRVPAPFHPQPSARHVTVHQTNSTTIHAHGQTGHEIAKAIAKTQSEVYADHLRQLKRPGG